MSQAASKPLQGEPGSSGDGQLASTSRTLRNSLISLAVFFAIVVGLLLGVPSLQSAAERITDAKPSWVVLAVVLELLSCTAYVVLFDLVFGRLGRSLSARLSLSELAVNSVVSLSGMAGIALGAWVLRSRGFAIERIAKRSVLIFVLTSAVNVGAVAVIGIPMWLGLLPGSSDPLLTLLPAGVAIAAVSGTFALAAWARRSMDERFDRSSRRAIALFAISGGIEDALAMIREGDWRLLGAIGYWLFDNLVLWACLHAFGRGPSIWAVAMAYLVGMLANSIPIPGGFFAVESGLVGMLVLFGAHPAALVIAAVVVYRAISLWIPALIGSVAFLSLRREIGKPAAPAMGAG